jgi:hypothetical protein
VTENSVTNAVPCDLHYENFFVSECGFLALRYALAIANYVIAIGQESNSSLHADAIAVEFYKEVHFHVVLFELADYFTKGLIGWLSAFNSLRLEVQSVVSASAY